MIYRKHGAVARWENGTLIRVTECGVAIEEGDYFECRPLDCEGHPAGTESQTALQPRVVVGGRGERDRVRGETGRVASTLQELRDLQFERLIITHGTAHHECDGRQWSEETDRIHASLVHDKLRALVDSTTRRLDDLRTVANALKRAEPDDRAIDTLRLEPNVTAALLPHLAGRVPSGGRLVQTAGGVDGYGNEIVEAESEWPNFYRPSYRVRPLRMPLNLRIECDNTQVDDDAPRAIALLAPVTGLTIRVLVVDGERVHPATVTVDHIGAVSNDRVWYPYGGGSFGAALML